MSYNWETALYDGNSRVERLLVPHENPSGYLYRTHGSQHLTFVPFGPEQPNWPHQYSKATENVISLVEHMKNSKDAACFLQGTRV